MDSAHYVGRKVCKQVVKSMLAAAFGKMSAQGSGDAVPRLFIFYGPEGSGKSTFIDLCSQSVDELGASNGKAAVSVPLDFDVARFRGGTLPGSIGATLDALYRAAAGAHERIAAQLAPFERMRLKIDDITWRKQSLIDTEWPREVLTAAPSAVDPGQRFTAWIESKIDPADLALAASADESLTALLADCLVNASLKTPFALIIDSLELAAAPVQQWLRDTFLPILVNRDDGIAVLLGGSGAWVRSFRNGFPERSQFALPFAGLSLTLPDIAELAAQRNIALSATQAVEIELATAGVPIAVGALLDYTAMKVPITDILPDPVETTDADRLVDKLVERFIQQGDDQTRMRVFSIALCYRFDKNLLSKLWGIPGNEIAPAVADIAGRYSFVSPGGRLHEAFRDRLRAYLYGELARGAESPLAGFLKSFTSVQVEHQVAELERKALQIADPLERYADRKFQAALLGYRYALALSSPHELLRALPGLYIEALIYNIDLAARLLEFDPEISALLSHDLLAMVGQLRVGIPLVQEAFSPLFPGRHGNARGLGFMENYRSSLGETQRALLHRLRGKLYGHAGNFTKAVEEFETARGFLPESTPARASLFGDFTAAGYAFKASGDAGKAIDAFAKAITLKPDDFAVWMELARMQQSMGEHKAAVESFETAVVIDPESAEAWFELGREASLLGEHRKAVDAFANVTRIDPRHAAAWFASALSLEALLRFSDSQEAANRVVALVPDHWEALFVLGRVLAAQYYSREAIDAFNKVVAIKPDCAGAWEALGRQLLAVESFESAANALEKAALLGGKGEELWHAVGMAWYGAANYENSVRACRKATGLRPEYFDAWVTLGYALTGMKDYPGACAAFQAAAAINPADRQVWVNVGNSLSGSGEYRAAVDAFLKATELRTDTDAIWLAIGRACQAQKKYTEAVDAFQKSIAVNQNGAEAWMEQGRSYAALGWYDDAAACFAKTVEIRPEAGDAWYHRGLALAATGKQVDAIFAFTRATELPGADGEVWFQLGLAHAATGKAEPAAAAFLRSIEFDRDRPEAHHQLGLARETLGLYEEAVGSFQQALALSPDREESLLRLGLCCNILGRYAESTDNLRKVLEINPGNKDALLPLALASHALGNYADAIGLYRQVTALQPDSEEAHYNLALALHATGNFGEALEAYLAVVRKWPTKDEAWYNLGLAHNAVQDYGQAIAAFREASRLNPESSDIWFELGTVYYATEQYGEAIQAFRKVIARNPAMFEAWYNLGNAYLIWGEFNDAIGAYKKAAELRPEEYSVWGCLGSAYHASGAYDKAVEAGSRALGLKADEPWVIGALGLSKLLSGDSAGANTLFERLLTIDGEGREIERIAAELRKTIGTRPAIAGAQEALQKLNGGIVIPSSGPLPGQGGARAS